MLEDGLWHGEIMDQHIHLDRKNRYLDAINEFVKVGGTAINLVHKPDFNNLPLESMRSLSSPPVPNDNEFVSC